MKYKPIVIVAGEPNSVFSEIFLKVFNQNTFKSPIILICSKAIFLKQSKFLKQKINFQDLNKKNIFNKNFKFKKLNLLNVDYYQKNAFEKISHKSNIYINNCFEIGLKVMKSGISNKFINGPISKKHFLTNKYIGITEYLASKTKTKSVAMLIYNKKLSVCPITTHLPLKNVSKKINKKLIKEKIKLISDFYKKINVKTKIAVVGLNPHCETTEKFDEDQKILTPTIKYLKKKRHNISGPYPADTIFIRKNREKFNVILGMYHDQVLTPLKTIFEYDAINITLGLPFIRISPDHGPNEKMLGKNISEPLSLAQAISFLDKN